MSRLSRVPAHPFVEDPDMPANHRGELTCRTCRLTGRQGDGRHPDLAPPLPARPLSPALAEAAHARDAAILGEKEDDDQ